MSEIFEALTVAHDQAVDRLKSWPPEREEPTDDSADFLQSPVFSIDVDRLGRLRDYAAQLPGRVALSHKKIRNYLILACVVVGLVLMATNQAFRPQGAAFGNGQSTYGVAFEGTIRPANEVRITSELEGTVSDVSVKVGDRVQEGQQLLRLDEREAQLALEQASVGLESAKAKLEKFRVQLADANARVEVLQRREQLVPTRQWRDSPERAAAAYDQALTNYRRAKDLFGAGVIAQQELEVRGTELKIARDDLENAKKLAGVSAKLEHDQADQANLQAKVTREELEEQLRQAELNYERAKQQAAATVVRATTAGVISEIPVRVGDRVPGGTVLAHLAQLDRMIAEVPASARAISQLKVGQSARVELPTVPPREIEGHIRVISPLPSQNMTHMVEVEFANPALLLVAGQPAEVRFVAP